MPVPEAQAMFLLVQNHERAHSGCTVSQGDGCIQPGSAVVAFGRLEGHHVALELKVIRDIKLEPFPITKHKPAEVIQHDIARVPRAGSFSVQLIL